MQLKEIQSTLQQIVVAIGAALQIEVEIADQQLFRVAGTGVIKSNIWREMRNEDYVYRKCLDTGHPVIIEYPGKEEVCQPCIHYGKCAEVGEVCCPIKVADKTIGVIGLLAFDPYQREKLFADLNINVMFLEKMANLIASKMVEYQHYQQQMLIKQKISTLVHYIDYGIVMINRKGHCDFINPTAQKLLDLQDNEIPNEELISQLVRDFPTQKKTTYQRTIVIRLSNRYKQLNVNYHPLITKEDKLDAIILLQDAEHITPIASNPSEESHSEFEPIIGNHPSIQVLKKLMSKIANSRSPILIRGENGTGKEFLSACIHRYSERRDKPYISVNCAVLPEKILLKELFGEFPSKNGEHMKKSKVEQANGGTLFLDDIADLPMSAQLRLLHVLEEKIIYSQDSNDPTFLDIRLITATDKALESLVAQGLFRKDLYYKLNVFPLQVPSLRDRKEDILLLAQYFLKQHCSITKKNVQLLDKEFKKVILSYDWPGNIRELSNVIEYAVNLEDGKSLSPHNLPSYLKEIKIVSSQNDIESNLNLRDVEKEVIQRAIHIVKERGEPKERAAKLLGIGRATLFRKLNEYQL